MLTGQNGILNRATEAKEKKDVEQKKEEILLAYNSILIEKNGYQNLNYDELQKAINDQFGENKAIVSGNGEEDGVFTISFIEEKQDYNITSKGIEKGKNWNDIMKNAKAPNEQKEERNDKVIGIGTDGNVVNMDLWKYTKLDDGSFALNDSESPNSFGYLGEFDSKGEIIGTIPQYISMDNGKTYGAVTSLHSLFKNCSGLKIPPKIPYTVTNMALTFSHTSISESPQIPMNVEVLSWCFEFTNLINMPLIPINVQRMYGSFYMCKSLKTASKLPQSVKIINYLFAGCENLALDNFIIDENVETMEHIFEDCYCLTGNLIINANPSSHNYTFYRCSINSDTYLILSGNSNVLQEILETKIDDSKIKIE